MRRLRSPLFIWGDRRGEAGRCESPPPPPKGGWGRGTLAKLFPLVLHFEVEPRVPEGESAPNGIRTFSVCIGSFKNITNARSLRERMISEGYGEAILAQNESGMYRVLVTGHDTKEAAVRSRDAIMQKYAPAFSDAWIVRRAY